MKKSKKTMYTAALLTAAYLLQGEIESPAADVAQEIPDTLPTVTPTVMSTVYGPPSIPYEFYKGDSNRDGKTDIVDYILMKAQLETNPDSLDKGFHDLNRDGILSLEDVKIMERYLFGKIPSVKDISPDDYDDSSVEMPTVKPTVMPTVTPVYGPPQAMMSDDEE